jgi:hypothetical protein
VRTFLSIAIVAVSALQRGPTAQLAASSTAALIGDRSIAVRPGVLVELFTSEGCSSCPPADALLSRLLSTQPVADTEVIPLEFHVDYWDRLGWKDPFSSAAFTNRQQSYSSVFGGDRVYTPQMVVDGAAEVVGSDEKLAVDAIRRAAARPHVPLGVSATTRKSAALRVSVAAPAAPGDSEPVDIVAALVEDGLTTSVTRGENRGRTLTHAAVVRHHQVIGALDRQAFVAEGEWPVNAGWTLSRARVVAFLQGRRSRRVYGAASSPVDRP